jgi:uroporphyrinogen-III synthase
MRPARKGGRATRHSGRTVTGSARVWVTRTAPFNLLTARHLRRWGIDPLLKPALDVRPLPSGMPILVPDALVFTSLHGVRLHRLLPSLVDLPVFAVGNHTARFARMRGYRRVESASGDVNDLRRLLNGRLESGSAILHYSAAQPAGDLVADLRQDGYAARRKVVYEAVEAEDAGLQRVVRELSSLRAILIHSPRSGRRVARLLKGHRTTWSGAVCCISPAAAAPFLHLGDVNVLTAASPCEGAMIELCKDAVWPWGRSRRIRDDSSASNC